MSWIVWEVVWIMTGERHHVVEPFYAGFAAHAHASQKPIWVGLAANKTDALAKAKAA